MKYRQGTVVSFDPNTLKNTVNVGGSLLTDLGLLGVGEARLLVPGSAVGILTTGNTSGVSTWTIIGRLVLPDTPDASNATALLDSQIHTDSIAIQETCSSITYGDLTTVGPQVTVNVTNTGRLLVILTTQIQQIDTNALDGNGGAATVEMSGANTLAASPGAALQPSSYFASGTTSSLVSQVTATGSIVYEGLSPGPTTLTVKYRCYVAGEDTDFGRRTLIVLNV